MIKRRSVSNEEHVAILTRFCAFCAYNRPNAQISDELLHDHLSSGLNGHKNDWLNFHKIS